MGAAPLVATGSKAEVPLLSREGAAPFATCICNRVRTWCYVSYMTLQIGPLRHVGLFTPNLDEHARFYIDVWGLQQVEATANAVFLRGSSPEHFILGLFRGSRRGLHHIAYAMPTEEA